MTSPESNPPSWISISARRVGLLSDTHGDLVCTSQGLEVLIAASVDLILHLGDLGSEQVVDRLAGLPVRLVLGNVDPPELASYAAFLGLDVDHPLMRLEIGDRRIVATHGHLDREVRAGMLDRPDYFIHGHTHRVRDERIEGTRFLNPGALQQTDGPSVAVLDLATDDFHLLEVPND